MQMLFVIWFVHPILKMYSEFLLLSYRYFSLIAIMVSLGLDGLGSDGSFRIRIMRLMLRGNSALYCRNSIYFTIKYLYFNFDF